MKSKDRNVGNKYLKIWIKLKLKSFFYCKLNIYFIFEIIYFCFFDILNYFKLFKIY